jgi:hypothetical protein
MSPIMEADFTGWGDVSATTPIHPKGDYQLTIKSIRASAWAKTDRSGNPTGVITKVIRIRPEIVGVYNSEGKLKTELGKKNIKGAKCEDINIWLHSPGGREMGKGTMMAIAGYNPRDGEEEAAFDKFIAQQKLDLGWVTEETADGYVLTIGDGWETLLVGKNVRAHMDEETVEIEGREPRIQQNYVRLSPVNA